MERTFVISDYYRISKISNNICKIWQCLTTQFAHAQSLPYQSPSRNLALATFSRR